MHLTAGRLDVPDTLQVRVEHVRSGQSQRFESVADLVTFMQRVLTNMAHNPAKETA